MKTITLKDETVAELLAALGVAGTPPVVEPPKQEPPASSISIPGYNVKVIQLPWETTIGTGHSTRQVDGFYSRDAIVWVLDVPADANSQGEQGSFRISPSDGRAYVSRILSVSDTPGDFSRKLALGSVVQASDARVYFTVGGHGKDAYGRDITRVADLTPGKRYYFTAVNAGALDGSADVNFGLTKPAHT